MKIALQGYALAAMLALAAAPASALRTEVVFGGPGASAQNAFPFSTLPGSYGYPSTRYQQVYSSSLFEGPMRIEELVFYPTGNLGATLVPATIEIRLSTTGVAVNEIDGRPFDDNLGPDAALFVSFDGGSEVTGSELAFGGRPYRYDPSLGNLLLDIRLLGAPDGHTGPFFAAFAPNGAGSLVSRWHDFGTAFDDRGLATGFRGAVPEPGTLLTLGLGLALVGAAVRRRTS